MSSHPSQNSARMMSSKMRCNKQGHKTQAIQFICIDSNCKASSRTGCITCFPEHDGHTQQHMDIDDFFREIHLKERALEGDYQSILTMIDTRRNTQQSTKKTQVSFKSLMQKIFIFLERHQEFLSHQIQAESKAQEIQQNFHLKVYHDELSRIKIKPTSQLDHKDMNFLLQFLSTDEFESMIQQQKRTKEQVSEQFQYQIDQIFQTFNEQFNQVMSDLDGIVMQNMNNGHTSHQTGQQNHQQHQHQYQQNNSHNQPHHQNNQMSTSPNSIRNQHHSPKVSTPIRKSMKTSPSSRRVTNDKTPDRNRPKKSKQPATQRFLITIPESRNSNITNQNKTLDNFVQYVQLNYLKEDVMNNNIEILIQHYPDVFGVFRNEKITQKSKIQLIQEQRGNLIKILWDNWMIEWLNTPMIQGGLNSNITIKVHEIEDNYQGFLELLEKSVQMHGIAAWLVKQKLNRPKVEYHSWFILAQGGSTKQQGRGTVDKVYRLYHIKSATKKDYKEQYTHDDQQENRDLRGLYGFTLAKIMQDSLHGDFKIGEDSKVIVKGFIDPNFQTFLMAERLQVFLTLASYNLNKQGLAMNIYNLENQFDNIMINFPVFITALNSVLREYGDYKPHDQHQTTFQQQAHSNINFY